MPESIDHTPLAEDTAAGETALAFEHLEQVLCADIGRSDDIAPPPAPEPR